MDDIDNLTDDEIAELYAKFVPIVELFNNQQEEPLSDHEAGLLLMFAKWLEDVDNEVIQRGGLQ